MAEEAIAEEVVETEETEEQEAETEAEPSIPYQRFSEVNDKRKAAERELQKARAALKRYDGFDPDEYQQLKDAAEQREAERLQNEGKWEEMKDRLQKAHEKELAKREDAVAKRDRVIEQLTVENELSRAIDEAGFLPEHRKAVRALLKLEAQPTVTWDDDVPRGLMGDVPIAEYVESWAKTDEAAYYLPTSGASGSGAKGGGGSRREPEKTIAEMSRDEKIEWRKNHTPQEWLDKLAAERRANMK